MENKSWLTAIKRNRASAPLTWLMRHNLIHGRVLDVGCGYGQDVLELQQLGYECEGYDPYYFPIPPEGKFDTVLCTYVLNVLQPQERLVPMVFIRHYLALNGAAYITVRRDIKQPTFTNNNTFQDNVELDCPIIYQNARFCIYSADKNYEYKI